MRACEVCGVRRAVVLQRHTGRALCLECFREDIIARARREVERWGMIEPGDTVMLALSGGKDSYVLLDILPDVVKPSKVLGVSVIEGIPGYNREEDVRRLREVARERGVEVVVTSIREYVGYSLYEVVSRAFKRGVRHAPCTYCGISRRRIINAVARTYGATKVVTAHNLDDEAQTVVVNFLRGDIAGLLKTHPLHRPKAPGVVPRVKPLRKVYEWETAALAHLKGYPLQETECMFINMQPTLRARVRQALYEVEAERPGTLLKIMEALDEALRDLASSGGPERLGVCERCGEPTSPGRRVCKLCEILEEAGVARPIYTLRLPRTNGLIAEVEAASEAEG
ncbi:MAG: TIGR00269 family protein [Desulfurococcales archaeon]|nr:TIGR00269 family protein [Desulfurococcales archaeon]